MSKYKNIIDTNYFDPNADLKDAEVKIKASELNKLRSNLKMCINALEHYADDDFWYECFKCEHCKPYWAMNWCKKPEDNEDYKPYTLAKDVIKEVFNEK